MAIAFDSAPAVVLNNGFNTGPVTKTWSHTVTGSNTILVLVANIWQDVAGTGTVTSATYNGTSLTNLISVTGPGSTMHTEIWYLLNPTSGTNTVSVTVTGATDAIKLSSISFTGVTAAGATNTNSSFGNHGTVAVTTTVANSWVVASLMKFGTAAVTVNNSFSTATNSSGSSTVGTSTYWGPQATAGSVTADETWTTNGDWVMGIIELKPSGGSTTTTSITKSTKYTVKTTPSAKTKSAKYTIKTTPSALTKSAKYTIKKTITAITKSAKYEVKKAVSITKSGKYTVKTTPAALTKSATYRLFLGSTAITKSSRYALRKTHALTKGAIYEVIRHPAITKSARYAIKKVSLLSKPSRYAIKNPHAITKSARYSIKTGHIITKSATYRIHRGTVAITKSAAYAIDKGIALTKSAKYAVKTTHTITKTASYSLAAATFLITKTAKYEVKTSHSLTRSAKYEIVKHPVLAKSARYAVKVSRMMTKAGTYTLRAFTASEIPHMQVFQDMSSININPTADTSSLMSVTDISSIDFKKTPETIITLNNPPVLGDSSTVLGDSATVYGDDSYSGETPQMIATVADSSNILIG